MLPGFTDIQGAGGTLTWMVQTVWQTKIQAPPQDFNKLWPVKDYAEDAAKLNKLFSTFGLALPTPYKTVEPFHVAFADMAYADLNYVCTAELTASAIAALGSSRKAYLYLFDYTPTEQEYYSLTGPIHTLEMAFLFGNFDEHVTFISGGTSTKWTPTAFEQKLSHTVMDYWLNFGRNLDPNGKGSGQPRWPTAGCGNNTNYLTFNQNNAGEAFACNDSARFFEMIGVNVCVHSLFAWF